jgi:hypothetical protein
MLDLGTWAAVAAVAGVVTMVTGLVVAWWTRPWRRNR